MCNSGLEFDHFLFYPKQISGVNMIFRRRVAERRMLHKMLPCNCNVPSLSPGGLLFAPKKSLKEKRTEKHLLK